MFSRIVSLFFFTLLLNACGWIQDKPKGAQNFQTKKLDLSCLQIAPVSVQKLFNGEFTSAPADVTQEQEIWQCLDVGLNTFSSKTKGSHSEYYTPEELQSFANRYLPASQPFTMEFVKSIFRLKMEVIGGNDTKLTQSEISILRDKISRFGTAIGPFAPYVGTILLKDGPDSPVKIEASNALNQFLLGLAAVLENSATSVKWASVNGFIIELERYANKGKPSALTLVREQADIYRAIKLMIVGGSEDSIEREKWTPIFQSISQAYNAIFLTSTSSSALERLSIEIGSTAAEQQKAVDLLKVTFLKLKADGTLTSQRAITQMSDRFAKILIVNGLLFPNTRGSLALKEFLGDANLRTLAGQILGELPRRQDTVLPLSQLRSISEHGLNFLVQASLVSYPGTTASQTSVSLATVEEDIVNLAPYFEKPSEKVALLDGLSALKKAMPLLIGKSVSDLSIADLHQLVEKFLNFYLLYCKIQVLPKDFSIGLNSTTLDLASAAVEGFMAASIKDIPLSELRTLILDVTANQGFRVRGRTVDKLLTGFYTRVFNHSKVGKPESINGLFLKTSQLETLIPLFDEIKTELLDSEKAFAGLDPKTQTLSRANLLSRLEIAGNRVVTKNIQPLLDGNTHLFHFPKKGAAHDQFSEYDIAYKSAIYSLINWIIPLYKIEFDPEGDKNRLSLFDLTDLLTDINDLVFDLRLSLADSPAEVTATARMLNMNLFTQVGNGDNYMDPLEATEFLTITSGGKVLLNRIEEELFPKCFAGITDYQSVKSIPYRCLTQVFFAKNFFKSVYTEIAPQLVDQYLKWDTNDLEIYRQSALSSTRPGWTEEGQLPMGDFESLIALPYFIENVFERYDHDQDDVLRFSELMNAFPIFCQQISDAGGGKLKGSCTPGENPRQIEAIYGYLIINGHPPAGTEPGNSIWRKLHAGIEVLRWFRYWNGLDRNPAVRDLEPPFLGRQDLLSIIANLAATKVDSGSSPLPGPDGLE